MSRYQRVAAAAAVTGGLIGLIGFFDSRAVKRNQLNLDYSKVTDNDFLNAKQEAQDFVDFEDQKAGIAHLTALEKHVLAFGKMKSGKVHFDAFTTAFSLRSLGEPLWPVIGFFVAWGSKLQAGKYCPFTSTEFNIEKGVHLGTSRLWKADGSFDEDRWQKVLEIISSDNGLITQAEWYDAVARLIGDDPEEPGTNRVVGAGIHSKQMQIDAAKREAREMFKLLGQKNDNHFSVPTGLVKLFFEDTRVAIMTVEKLKQGMSDAVHNSSPVLAG